MKAGTGEKATLARFVVTGGTAALLFVAVAFALRSWAGLPPSGASTAAFLAAFAFSYTMQRRWTFGGRHSHRRAFPRYLAAQGACLVLSAVLSEALSRYGHATPLAMAVSTSIVVSAASFVLSRFWVFAGDDPPVAPLEQIAIRSNHLSREEARKNEHLEPAPRAQASGSGSRLTGPAPGGSSRPRAP